MASILSTSAHGPRPKTYVSSGALPPFIDPKQAPTRRSPWRQIREMPFISSVTLTLPEKFYTTIVQPGRSHFFTSSLLQPPLSGVPSSSSSSSSSSTVPAPNRELRPLLPANEYAKVILTLKDIITGDFFTTYVKTGNVLMLSEGVPGVSSWLCHLLDGRLKIEMAKEVYEQCGLQGKPADRNSGARKHTRDWWIVDIDLRAPAMVRGRKGFERLLRASEGPLQDGKVWLFRDLSKVDVTTGEEKNKNKRKRNAEHDESDGGIIDKSGSVIDSFHPTTIQIHPNIRTMAGVCIPATLMRTNTTSLIQPPTELQDEEDYHALTEWLDLVLLDSPRVIANDKSDPYISRYSVDNAVAVDINHDGERTTDTLVTVTWKGLLDGQWCISLLIELIRASRRSSHKTNQSDSNDKGQSRLQNNDFSVPRTSNISNEEIIVSDRNEKNNWLALTVKAHRTEALGHVDGCTIFLGSSSSVADLDATGAGSESQLHSELEDKKEKKSMTNADSNSNSTSNSNLDTATTVGTHNQLSTRTELCRQERMAHINRPANTDADADADAYANTDANTVTTGLRQFTVFRFVDAVMT